MSLKKVQLGEVCQIIKGTTGIQKAIPGKYPLVVTGEERKTHNEFQFDCEAVVIPLVSGTGHGHASIKRIHYQSGKFALGNILCAVIPKDSKQLNPQYLYRFLDLNKENELVARMKGMANVTLPIKEISQIEIPIPTLQEQSLFIETYNDLEKNSNKLKSELSHQLTLVKKLRKQFWQDAVQGNLLIHDPSQKDTAESASELLKMIKAEKAKLFSEKKNKKEKELPPINPEEIPFGIPEAWVWCRIANITNFIDYRGKTPNKVDRGIKLITAKNVKFGYFSTEPEEYISELDYANHMTRGIPNNGDILFTTEAPLGNACLLDYKNKFAIAQRIITIQPILLNTQFLLYTILSKVIQKQLIKKQSGLAAKGIKSSRLVEVLVPLPPLTEQHRIVEKLDELMKYCDDMEASIKESQAQNEKLLQQILREALRG